MNLDAKIEAILFAAAHPFSTKRLAELCEADKSQVKEALKILTERLEECSSGLQLAMHDEEAELVTRPEAAALVRETIKDETQSELTRPSLEALAVLAYRGPMTRPELEQIRGVQSALILRNLMLRGLVEMREDTRLGQPVYSVTMDFVKYLGLDRLESLPTYEELHGHPVVEQVLKELEEAPAKSTDTTVTI